MKSAVCLTLSTLLIGISLSNYAQKRWDGEEGDGQWNSARNWLPDGVPLYNEAVILNNDLIPSSYHVTLPFSNTAVEFFSLQINGSPQQVVSLEIPDGSTASPAIITQNITIGKNGLIVNSSGAPAGNTFSLSGFIKIEDGGKYIHKTLRGNAYLISKLLMSSGCEKGIVEFDVPGNAGYILSLSGKEFGCLVLNSEKAGGKKSYSASGNSDLIIHGNLQTEKGATLISSLTSNVHLKGNIINNGSLFLNPTSSGVNGRALLFKGDSSYFFSIGTFQQNSNFTKILIDYNASLKLFSAMSITNASTKFEISPNGMFNPDTTCVLGGSFIADSSAVLTIGSADGISHENGLGNIQCNSMEFHPKSRFLFESSGDQKCGNAFPEKCAYVKMNKPVGNLILTKPILVSDSISLIKGKIISTKEFIITLNGNFTQSSQNPSEWKAGNENSFICGPFRYISDTLNVLDFPTGKNNQFSPLRITRDSSFPASYTVEYFEGPSERVDSTKSYPLQRISKKEYWVIDKSTSLAEQSASEKISLYKHPTSLSELTQFPVIAWYTNDTRIWTAINPKSNGFTSTSITGTSFTIKSGECTFGEVKTIALPFNDLTLSYSKRNRQTDLIWHYNNDKEVDFYQVEESLDGKTFKPIYAKESGNILNTTSYHYEFIPDKLYDKYFLVSAFRNQTKIMQSNIIHIGSQFVETILYPNPALTTLFINATKKTEPFTHIYIVTQKGQLIQPRWKNNNGTYEIDIVNITKGVYTILLCRKDALVEQKQFIKE